MVALLRQLFIALCVVFALGSESVQADFWQPSPGHTQVPIRPGAVPDAIPEPKSESADSGGGTNDVSRPTIAVYEAKGRNTGAAAVVFPGGGYRTLAMGGEGTEICDWLTSRGIICALLKYRVPGSGPWWDEEHAQANLQTKRDALARLPLPGTTGRSRWKHDASVLTWLDSL
jgi:hypothetical protein